MARIRSIKPELCDSEVMASCSAEVERTFLRLWTHCDDEGRTKDNPRLIKAALFPLHDDVTAQTVDEHLDVLASKGLIIRYETDGKRYLAVTNWTEHQKPQKRIPSKLPPPNQGVRVVRPGDSRSPTVATAEPYGPVVGEVEVEVEVEEQTLVDETSTASEPVHVVFNAWVESTGRSKTRTKLDKKRRMRIATALKNYDLDDLVDAVNGWRSVAYNRGENATGTVYNDIGLLLRDSEHIEKFRDAKRGERHLVAVTSGGFDALSELNQRAL